MRIELREELGHAVPRNCRDECGVRVFVSEPAKFCGIETIYLVEHEDDWGPGRLLQPGDLHKRSWRTSSGVGYVGNDVCIGQRNERRRAHRLLKRVRGLEESGGVEDYHLRVGRRVDSDDAIAAGL